MAERRCFSMKIVDSDAFVEMPLSAQALYFHLGMRADDDGFINKPNRIARDVGASGDDLKLLIAKRFILAFDTGVVVVKHWMIHNTLRKDRLKPPHYPELAARIYIKGNDGYTDNPETDDVSLLEYRVSVKCLSVDSQMSDNCPSNDSQLPGKCQHKVSKGKSRKDNITIRQVEGSAFDSDSDDELSTNFSTGRLFELQQGTLGKGVVLLTPEQDEFLLDKLGYDGYNHYVAKLADFILKKDAKVSNHYATILKWAEEDSRC